MFVAGCKNIKPNSQPVTILAVTSQNTYVKDISCVAITDIQYLHVKSLTKTVIGNNNLYFFHSNTIWHGAVWSAEYDDILAFPAWICRYVRFTRIYSKTHNMKHLLGVLIKYLRGGTVHPLIGQWLNNNVKSNQFTIVAFCELLKK